MFYYQSGARETEEVKKKNREMERKGKGVMRQQERGEYPINESLTSFWLVPMHIHLRLFPSLGI